nr:hypothetical protein [Tanacetum cinerariifolium]
MIAGIKVEEEIIRALERLDIELYVRGQHDYWASLRIEPDLISRIKLRRRTARYGLSSRTSTSREALLTEAHSSPFSVKIKHQWASGLLQQLDIPVWKWDEISMDAIWVVVDRLTKSAHFLPIRKDYSVSRLVEIFQQEIDQVGERVIEGPEMIEVTNAKVVVAKEKLKEARTRQKSYADKHRRSLEFQLGYKYHPLHVISYPLDQIRTDLSYVEEPEAILDRQDRVMRKKTIPFIKILWRNHPEREATWETEESIQTSYPHFLP